MPAVGQAGAGASGDTVSDVDDAGASEDTSDDDSAVTEFRLSLTRRTAAFAKDVSSAASDGSALWQACWRERNPVCTAGLPDE